MLARDIVLVRVTVRPVSDKPIKVSLDDFLLVSGKDGQRAEPYTPSQIAGSGTLGGYAPGSQQAKTGFGIGLGGMIGGGSGGSRRRHQKWKPKWRRATPTSPIHCLRY